ncbi:MAG TPA: DUF2891 domain-containing protein [Acetobacteraceae bacterium]|nr:DUF2891 domain-containing protein [Acetobacteraceae bacterium]
MLSLEHASRFAGIALGHVTREYPNKLDQVLTGPADLLPPRALHPIFYGSFDWHSCVHAYWLLARLLRRHPEMPQAAGIRAQFRSALTADNVAAECAYLARPLTATFERPYGWAWLLMFAAELNRQDTAEARHWSATLAPLAEAFSHRFLQWLPKAAYPSRSGLHSNTAFALILALDYSAAAGDAALAEAGRGAARAWYLQDADCQAWEPSSEDFLSPCLAEALCMQRVLPPEEFLPWFRRFLPQILRHQPATLFQPVSVSDRSDGRIAHLDGLNLSRAWCWSELARALPVDAPERPVMGDAASRHLQASLPHVSGDYMGEHWLASFATLALEAAD